MRVSSSLSSGLPGTMARPPLRNSPKAPARVSRRSLALRCASSGPWQLKQVSDRIGRTSRVKSIRVAAGSPVAAPAPANRAASKQPRTATATRGAGRTEGRNAEVTSDSSFDQGRQEFYRTVYKIAAALRGNSCPTAPVAARPSPREGNGGPSPNCMRNDSDGWKLAGPAGPGERGRLGCQHHVGGDVWGPDRGRGRTGGVHHFSLLPPTRRGRQDLTASPAHRGRAPSAPSDPRSAWVRGVPPPPLAGAGAGGRGMAAGTGSAGVLPTPRGVFPPWTLAPTPPPAYHDATTGKRTSRPLTSPSGGVIPCVRTSCLWACCWPRPARVWPGPTSPCC